MCAHGCCAFCCALQSAGVPSILNSDLSRFDTRSVAPAAKAVAVVRADPSPKVPASVMALDSAHRGAGPKQEWLKAEMKCKDFHFQKYSEEIKTQLVSAHAVAARPAC